MTSASSAARHPRGEASSRVRESLIGVGTFAGGTLFFGRLFAEGALILLAAALMPLVPVNLWPGVYGLVMALAQFWYGVLLLRLDREANPAPPP